MTRKLLINFLWTLIPTFAFGQLNEWQGGASGDWNIAGNWTQGVPTASHDVVIDANAMVTLQAVNPTVRSVTVSSGSSLVVSNGITLNIQGSATTKLSATLLTNHGTININAAASTTSPLLLSGTTTNFGSINVSNGNACTNSGSLNNHGTLSFSVITPSFSVPAFSNSGSIQNTGMIVIDSVVGTSADAIFNGDTIVNQANGKILISRIDGPTQAHGFENEKYFLNQGSLEIDRIYGENARGFRNEDEVLNNGTIKISNVMESYNLELVFNGASFVNNDSLIISNEDGFEAGGIDVDINTTFTNGPSSFLEVNGISGTIPTAILCDGTLTNMNDIEIKNLNGGRGIWNGGNVINQDQIEFENMLSGAIGILNFGPFNNQNSASIDFSSFTGNAVLNHDTLINEGSIRAEFFNTPSVVCDIESGGYMSNSGSITFTDSDATYLEVSSNGKFQNMGSGMISLLNNSGPAISCFGNLENNGEIMARALNDGTGNLIFISGDFLNNGGLSLNNSTGKGFNISNSAMLTNNGSIVIDTLSGAGNDGMVISNGNVLNNGLISVRNVLGGDGISTTGDSVLVNNDSIVINSVSAVGFSAFAPIVNDGYLSVSNTGEDGLNSWDLCLNNGEMNFTNCTQEGIENNDSLINNSGASILIDTVTNASSYGLLNNTGRFLQNMGSLEIKNVSFWGVDNRGVFLNYSELTISNISNEAFVNRDSLKNMTNGRIIISDITGAGSDGIYNLNGGSCHNQGLLFIENVGNYGINNFSTFINDTCGQIQLFDEIRNAVNPSFQNLGYIFQNSSSSNSFLTNFENLGVYVDQDSSSANQGNFIDNGIYLGTMNGTFTCLDTIQDFASGPNNLGLIMNTNIFSDSTATTSVGTVEQDSNSIYLGNNVPSSGYVFIPISWPGSCTRSIKIPFSNLFSCQGVNIWDGGNGTISWFDPSNWSMDQVPTSSMEVLIPSGYTVEVPSAKAALCKFIEVQTNVVFTVNGTLEVAGN